MACSQLPTLQNQRMTLLAAQPGLETAVAVAKLALEQNRAAVAVVDIEIAICQAEGTQAMKAQKKRTKAVGGESLQSQLRKWRAYQEKLRMCGDELDPAWIGEVNAVLKTAPK